MKILHPANTHHYGIFLLASLSTQILNNMLIKHPSTSMYYLDISLKLSDSTTDSNDCKMNSFPGFHFQTKTYQSIIYIFLFFSIAEERMIRKEKWERQEL